MSTNPMRDDVLREFEAWDRCLNQIEEEVHWSSAERMADEIVRLRKTLTAADHIAALVAMGAERFYSFDDGEEVLSLYKIPEEMRDEPRA